MLKKLFRAFFPGGGPQAGVILMVRGQGLLLGGYADQVIQAIHQLHLTGWLRKHETFLEMSLDGSRRDLETLIDKMRNVPGMTKIKALEVSWKQHPTGHIGFRIK
jgi:hypothetical protein